MRGGKVLYGDAAVVNALAMGCEALDVCGAAKSICAAGEILDKNKMPESYAMLAAANLGSYPAFFCGAPPANEPTCSPKRPTSVNGSSIYTGASTPDDMDGDGIANAC